MSQAQGNLGPLPLVPALLPRLSPKLWLAALLLVAVAALLPGLWTAAGLVGLLGCLVMLARPEAAVYLLTLSVPLGSLLEVKLGSISVTPTEGLAALLAIGWAARALARRRLTIPLTPLSLPLAAMLFAAGISAHQATDLSLTLKETLKWLELVLVYLFIVSEMGTAGHATALLAALFAGAVVEALVGFVQFGLGIGPEPFAIGRYMRAYGSFEQPNPYAGYLGMLIPLAVGLLLTRHGRRLMNWSLVAGALAVAAVGMSLSRGAWVGIALALALMMLSWSRRSRLLLTLGALASTPLVALAFLNLLPGEITSRLATAADYFRFIDVRQEVATPENWAVVERVAHWQAALDMIAAHPLLGVGAGNYPAVYGLYSVPGWDEALGHAHNYYLNVAAEMGIPTLLVYLSIVLTALAYAVRWLLLSPLPMGEGQSEGRSHPLLWRGILVGVLGALVASSVHNLFDSLFVHSMSVQLGMILALGQISASALSGQLKTPGRGDTGVFSASPPLRASPSLAAESHLSHE